MQQTSLYLFRFYYRIYTILYVSAERCQAIELIQNT